MLKADFKLAWFAELKMKQTLNFLAARGNFIFENSDRPKKFNES